TIVASSCAAWKRVMRCGLDGGYSATELWSRGGATLTVAAKLMGHDPAMTRLERAVTDGESLTDLDWARTLLLTDVTFASSLIGAGWISRWLRHFRRRGDHVASRLAAQDRRL